MIKTTTGPSVMAKEPVQQHPLENTTAFVVDFEKESVSNNADDPFVFEYALLENYFDTKFYLQQTLDKSAQDDPIAHYMREGWKLGIDPHPDFSSKFYLRRSPDVREAGIVPFLHYIQWGRYEGRLPKADFRDVSKNSGHSLDVIELTRRSFDFEMYMAEDERIHRCNVDPVLHYLSFGWREGRNPAKNFSTQYYLERNPDVRKAGINPFVHYLTWGRAEGRRGHTDDGSARYSRWADTETHKVFESHFDVDYYRSQKNELTTNDANPFKHYRSVGWLEDLDPNSQFSTAFYKKVHRKVDFTNRDPFSDYLLNGATQGSVPRPVDPVLNATDGNVRVLLSKNIIAESFDAGFYRDSSPDLQGADIDYLEHFLLFGWRENRDPAPWFSTSYYRQSYPRAEAYEIDPLTHYLIWGRSQGFKTHPNLPPAVRPKALRDISCVTDKMLHDANHVKSGTIADPVLSYNSNHMDVHWVIPNYGIGGGGHMTIFRMVHWLEYLGHRCTIWINTKDPLNLDSRYDDILKYYQFVKAELRVITPEFVETQGDALIATSWDTAALVSTAKGFKDRFYFVQDYEPMFYARGSRGVLAEETYNLDLACICASPWLRRMLETQHGRWARDFYLSYDPDFYYAAATADRKNKVPRIAVYSRIGTERRCVELALLALEHLARQGIDFHVDIFGTDRSFEDLIFSSTFHGVLSADELGSIYRSCDLGLCFSATNYSLVPQEMMACGLPVIEMDVESTRHSISRDAAYFTSPLPEKIAESICYLLTNPRERLELARRGQAWAESTSWESAARVVESALRERLSEGPWEDRRPVSPALIKKEPVKASVIIPTLNGGQRFEEIIQRLEGQKAQWPFELIVVDSGSTDNTLIAAKKLPFAKTIEIPKKDFQHGRTRNLGVANSSGEYVVFLTQDAVPLDCFWLYNFVSTMEKFPDARGGFGKHLAHRTASVSTKMEMRNHFAGFDRFPLLMSKYTDLDKWNSGDLGWRQILHFYSDNNSCMRRDAWNELPYPEIIYGEDQLWAQQAILRGWSKVYCPNAIVQHSHEYNYEETLERADIEAWFYRKYFGYNISVPNIDQEISARDAQAERLGIKYGLSREEIDGQKRNGAAQLMGWQLGRQRGEMERYKIDKHAGFELEFEIDHVLREDAASASR
ncbi:rhamnosyltransferase WsaF family glycosyltransferase [Rhizobium sp. 9140]|uniref:rhamnosyltransferase WsaF family glycosyltransferase n=1 Tax=Rhizobium sp. 9140 TaxID=1761900 RepID=UPI000791779A|nr:glycosyltransferase [Rhizobium sp. 9140]CZT37366.1 Glycosyltransferase involved in cell wall bisynthesis [Rhizobium sp. 9140]